MNTLERIASDIAERIGPESPYAGEPSSWTGETFGFYFNERFVPQVNAVIEVLHRFERAGKIVVVTDDKAVFAFPVPKDGASQ